MAHSGFRLSSVSLREDQDTWERRVLIFCILLVILAALYALFPYVSGIALQVNWSNLLTNISLVLLLLLVILYHHAATFYKNRFYLFIGLAWLANFLYILSGQGSPGVEDFGAYMTFRSSQMLLALVTDVPLYLASSATGKKPNITYKALFVPISIILVWFVIHLSSSDIVFQTRLQIVLAVSFATYVSFRVYRAIDYQVTGKSYIGRQLLKNTFLAFALLQPTYLFAFSDRLRPGIIWIMGIVLVVKGINAFALVLLLREDYAEIRAANEKARMDVERAKEALSRRAEFEEIGILTAAIEHELRTPAGVMGASIRDLKRRYQANEELVKELTVLDQQRTRLIAATRIIKALRSSNALLTEKMEVTAVANIARKAVDDLRNSISVDDVHFKIEEHKHNLAVVAYKPLLQQAFLNILKNGIESIKSSRERGKIEIAIGLNRESRQSIEITFCDNGNGLPEQFLDKLASPGFSFNKRDRENSGLGLFVTDRIAKIHGGEIRLRNSAEGGAIVSVILPRYLPQRKKLPVQRPETLLTDIVENDT